jgi:hypothetical protein
VDKAPARLPEQCRKAHGSAATEFSPRDSATSSRCAFWWIARHIAFLSIRRGLDDLREKVENVIGFQKEIDHALERITAIEKHLGINRKIAA